MSEVIGWVILVTGIITLGGIMLGPWGAVGLIMIGFGCLLLKS